MVITYLFLGDFYVEICKATVSDIVTKFGQGTSQERGDKLVEYVM